MRRRRLLAPDGRADPLAGRPARPRGGGAPPPRRRGELSGRHARNWRQAGAGPVRSHRTGRGRDWATHVAIAEWEGPLGLLLSLIEARRYDVLTVPLGGVAEAYLEALATIEHDRMSSISSFVAVASQLILIKSRAMLPRATVGAAVELEDEGVDPEAELRTRLLLYSAFRDAGARSSGGHRPFGLFRREPSAALAAGLAGAATAPSTPPIDPAVLVRALGAWSRSCRRPSRRPRSSGALDHARPARVDHPARRCRAPRSCSRTCSRASMIVS